MWDQQYARRRCYNLSRFLWTLLTRATHKVDRMVLNALFSNVDCPHILWADCARRHKEFQYKYVQGRTVTFETALMMSTPERHRLPS